MRDEKILSVLVTMIEKLENRVEELEKEVKELKNVRIANEIYKKRIKAKELKKKGKTKEEILFETGISFDEIDNM